MLAAAPLLQLLMRGRGGLVGKASAAAAAATARSAATAAAASRSGQGKGKASAPATPATPSIPPILNPTSLSFDDLHSALSQRANRSRNPQPESGLVLLASKASSAAELERCLAVVRANARRRARLGQRPSHSPRVGAALASAAARVGAPASWAVDLVARAEEFGVAATGGLAERAAALCAQQGDAASAEALAMATRARSALLGGGGRAPPALTRNQATDAVRAAVKAAQQGGGGGDGEGAATAGAELAAILAAQARDLGKLGPMASRIAAGGAGGSGGGAGGTGGGTAEAGVTAAGASEAR